MINKRILRLHDLAVEVEGSEKYFSGKLDPYKFAASIVEDCVYVLSQRLNGRFDREDLSVRACIRDVKKRFEAK